MIRTNTGRSLSLLLAEADIRWPDDSTRLSSQAISKLIEKIEEEAPEFSIDVEHLATQRAWSQQTFGPGPRTKGVMDHIRKEFLEIEEDPTEWIDVIVLAFDGALRADMSPAEIIARLKDKMQVNFKRSWPDWRTAPEDQAIEHIREVAP